MPRSRGSEVPQRVSPRASLQLRTSSSDSDPLHHRSVATERSPKVGDRRSPRGAQSDPLNQKKLGTRIGDLESQLGQAQDELKILKDQLASAEAAKKEAQEQLGKKTQKPSASDPVEVQDNGGVQESNDKTDNVPLPQISNESQHETDVFEVPMEKTTVQSNSEFSPPIDEDNHEGKPISESTKYDDWAMKNDEINILKADMEEREKKLEVFRQENESLKFQLNKAVLEISTSRAKEEEMGSSMSQLQQQLEASRGNEVVLKEKLEVVEGAKEALESEMKKLRVQTEQWRKAADAGAAVLSGGVDMNGRRISERCGSMDNKHFGSVFEPSADGYAGFVGSPGLGEDSDDGFRSGKRKGSGMKMFGDLWKKKGHK